MDYPSCKQTLSVSEATGLQGDAKRESQPLKPFGLPRAGCYTNGRNAARMCGTDTFTNRGLSDYLKELWDGRPFKMIPVLLQPLRHTLEEVEHGLGNCWN